MPASTSIRRCEDVVGLDWSDGVVTASRVSLKADGALTIHNVGWTSMPAGAADQALAAAIREVWRTAGMPSRTVAASIRSRSVIVRYFSFPSLQPEELKAALWLEAEESLQLPQSGIAMDFHINRRSDAPVEKSGARAYEGLLVAAPRAEVERDLSILRAAGLYPVVLDLGATAIANLFKILYRDPVSGSNIAIVHVSQVSADIVILLEGGGLYARTLYARGANWEASSAALIEGILEAMKFYVFKLRGQPVRKLMMAGSLPKSPDFLGMVRTKTGVAVEVWNPMSMAEFSGIGRKKQMVGADAPPLGISLGLALRSYAND